MPFASWRTFHLPEPRTLVCALLGREYCSGYRVSRKEKKKNNYYEKRDFIALNESSHRMSAHAIADDIADNVAKRQ